MREALFFAREFFCSAFRFYTIAVKDHTDDKTDHKDIQPKQKYDDGAERAVKFVHVADF